MLSLQEIFDKGLAHIRQQGAPSMEGSSCKYLCENGNSCVVGGLMLPELRSSNFDAADCTTVRTMASGGQAERGFVYALAKSGVNTRGGGVLDLLAEMQMCHDSASSHGGAFIEHFEATMSQTAKRLGLVYKAAL